MFLLTPPPGIEPGTFRLGSVTRAEQTRPLTAFWGNAGATLEAAQRLIVAVASGTIDGDVLRTLADAVLNDERVRLAREVTEGGPHATRRAIELAALILADASAVDVRAKRDAG